MGRLGPVRRALAKLRNCPKVPPRGQAVRPRDGPDPKKTLSPDAYRLGDGLEAVLRRTKGPVRAKGADKDRAGDRDVPQGQPHAAVAAEPYEACHMHCCTLGSIMPATSLRCFGRKRAWRPSATPAPPPATRKP